MSISVSIWTGGVREINVLREVGPATFSVSIETEATFLLFQSGLVHRVIVFSMSASCSSATCPTLEAERRNIFPHNLLQANGWTSACEFVEPVLASPNRSISSDLIGTEPGFQSQLKPNKSMGSCPVPH